MRRKIIIFITLLMLILIPVNVFASGLTGGIAKKQAILAAKNKMITIKENLINERSILKDIRNKNKLIKSLLKESKNGNNLTSEEKKAILAKVKEIKQLVNEAKISVSDMKIIWNKAKSNNKIRSYKELGQNLDDIIELQQKKLNYLNQINRDFDNLIKLLHNQE